jgi:hypothetical protein
MPITPFHLGIGALAKGAIPSRVSFVAFVASQVVIDCETAYYIVTRQWPLHRWAHTFALGLPLGAAVGFGVWLTASAWRRGPLRRLPAAETARGPALLGGAIGGLTHPLLDGIMHTDIAPLRPFVEHNPLLGIFGLGALHMLCVLAGLLGIGLMTLRRQSRDGQGGRLAPPNDPGR